ncbi:MAG: ACS family MFS transporter [Rhodocyclaceae bacterium]|nr:ACS family MFS transporter [Rhodocyclaceae bacterium]
MTSHQPVAQLGVGKLPVRYPLLALCFFACLICYLDRISISVAVIAMQEQFGWSETTKGLVLSSFFIGYMLCQVPSGWLANRLGGKIMLSVAVIWWSAFTFLTPLAAAISLPVLLATRVLMGVGEAGMFPSVFNLFSRWTPLHQRSRFVALVLSGAPVGNVIGLAVSGWLATQFGWQAIFYVFGLLGVLWAIAWIPSSYNDPRQHPRISREELELLDRDRPSDATPGAVPWRRLLTQPAVWALMVNGFCSAWTLYVLLAWLPSYFNKIYGMNMLKAGFYSAAPWITLFILVNAGGWIADAMTRRHISTTSVRKTMQASGLIGSALFLMVARQMTTPETALAAICLALGFVGLTWSGYGINSLDIAPRYADVLSGMTFTAANIPGIIAVMVTGWMLDLTGSYDAPFLLGASISVFGAIVYLIWGSGEPLVD